MASECVIQGRRIGPEDVATVRRLLAENPECSRYKFSRLLCQSWEWCDPTGQLKEMAARSLLLKLQDRGWIVWPATRCASPNRMLHKRVAPVDHATEPMVTSLRDLLPLSVRELSRHPEEQPLFEWPRHRHHYLSHTSTVGLNLNYLVYERGSRPVPCRLFGTATWKCAVRDHDIGWSVPERERGLE